MQSSRIELTVLGIILHSELLVESGSGNRVEINSLARSLLFFFLFSIKEEFFFLRSYLFLCEGFGIEDAIRGSRKEWELERNVVLVLEIISRNNISMSNIFEIFNHRMNLDEEEIVWEEM